MDIAGNRTLYSIFTAYAKQQPAREWLLFERGDGQVFRWTYAQFLDSVYQAANLLRSLGIGAGDVFNLHLSNHPAYPQLILAASYLGATAMPTNPVSTADELGYLIEHSASKVIFTEASCLEVVHQMPVQQVILCETGDTLPDGYPVYETEMAKQPLTPPASEGGANQVVQLMYTSGTTARPKGVMLTNTAFIYGAEVFRGASGLRHEDRHLIALPLFHAAAQCHALWPSLISGASVAIMSRFSASRFFAQAVEYSATMAALFGAPLRMLLNQPEHASDMDHSLRNITFAQNLTEEQYDEWHRRFRVPLQQLWGMTETAGLPLMSPLTGKRNLLAMGRPVVGYELKVVDELTLKEVQPGQPGHLIVRGIPGRSLMLGYLKNPEATARTLRIINGQTWLFSGDTAYYDEEGFVYFVDRGKDLIRRAGENISSTQVEHIIMQIPNVLDVCVVGIPDALRDEAVVAVVVLKPDTTLTSEAIQAHCGRYLAPFKVPERVEFVDALPRTSVGKIQKNIVRDRLKSSASDVH